MSIKTSSAKAKGRKLQQHVMRILLSLSPSLEPDDVKSTGMGQGGEDVQLSPAARKLWKVSLECKARKSIASYSWYSQAEDNCPDGSEPVVVMKADRKKPLVVVDADYFFDLYRKAEDGTRNIQDSTPPETSS